MKDLNGYFFVFLIASVLILTALCAYYCNKSNHYEFMYKAQQVETELARKGICIDKEIFILTSPGHVLKRVVVNPEAVK